MLEVQVIEDQVSLLKTVMESIMVLANDAKFDFSSTGFSLQAVDPRGCAIVSLLLRSDGFEHYHCDRDLSLGMNIGNIVKMLKCAGYDGSVTIKADDGSDCVTFMVEDFDQDSITNFEMKLMDIDDVRYEITEEEFDAIVRMPSSEFARICKDLSTMGDTVVISVTKEGLEFSTKGDTGAANILCRQKKGWSYADMREEPTIIEMEAPVSLTFELSFLKSFTKATPLASQVTLSLLSGRPIVVEYKIPKMGHLRFYLAPKLKEDEEMNGESVETKKQPKKKLKTEHKSNGETKRHRAKVEKIKVAKLRLEKEEQEYKVILLKEEVRMMQQKQMDKDMRFFLTSHDNLTGAALNAVLARKREIAQRWGWE